MALEIAKNGIRLNVVAPRPTAGTPENKAALVTTVSLGRLGLSEEFANAIVFIASDEASYITGHVPNVDGGKSRKLIYRLCQPSSPSPPTRTNSRAS